MFSTICLLFFAAFILWMNTSKRIIWRDKPELLQRLAKESVRSKYISSFLMVMAASLSVYQLGLGSGLFAAVVVLMCMGSLIVLFFPFRYVRLPWVIGTYLVCFLMEYLIR